MTEDSSPENLRKFLESDDPAMVRMGLSMAKGTGIPEDFYNSITLALIERTTENWNEMYGQLLAFSEKHGHSSPATKIGGALGSWVSTQRTFYRKNLISKKRISLLEKLPKWTWNIQESKWHGFFNQLIEHVKVHGNADPPIDQQLGIWCRTQRVKYSKTGISHREK